MSFIRALMAKVRITAASVSAESTALFIFDYFNKLWSKVVLAIRGDLPEDPDWNSVKVYLPLEPDPLWSKVVFLCHMDGSNGGTTFTDEKGHMITPVAGVTTNTSTKKFGTASA